MEYFEEKKKKIPEEIIKSLLSKDELNIEETKYLKAAFYFLKFVIENPEKEDEELAIKIVMKKSLLCRNCVINTIKEIIEGCDECKIKVIEKGNKIFGENLGTEKRFYY